MSVLVLSGGVNAGVWRRGLGGVSSALRTEETWVGFGLNLLMLSRSMAMSRTFGFSMLQWYLSFPISFVVFPVQFRYPQAG